MTQQEFFDRYTFNVRTDKIGGGSFGTVYRAYDNTRDREVAIKVSEVREMGGKEFSLRDEFKAIGNLPVHANIAHYEDVFTFESPQGVFDYAVMQYYKEGNLSSFLESHPQLSFEERESICKAILDGITHLHLHKVVHRDLKPGNILVVRRKNGAIVPKITDFGLSKQAGTDVKASRFTNSFAGGTLMYSSPEQIRGDKLKLNTDLWSFGAIAYEVLKGEQLFQVDGYSSASAEWQNQMTQQILKEDIEIRIKNLPENWRKVLSKCLQREFEQRVKSTDDIKDILLGVGENISTKGIEPKVEIENNDFTLINTKQDKIKEEKPKRPTPSMAGTRPKVKEERKWPYALALGIIAALAGFGIWSFTGNSNDLAQKEAEISLFQEDGIYGYRIGDSTVIAPKYKQAGNFIDGEAKVSTNDSTYYINQSEEWVGGFKTEDEPDIVGKETIAQIEDKSNNTPPVSEEITPNKEKESNNTSDQDTSSDIADKNGKTSWRPKKDFIPKNELENWVKANGIEELTQAANNGNAIAQRRLGRIYSFGAGVPENKIKEIKWYKAAAALGDAMAQFNLGVNYKNGDGVSQDDAEGVKWYKKSANQGNKYAQYNLALAYEEGKGIAKNDTEAVNWFKKSANQGYANAQNNLGVLYKDGKLVSKDFTEANKWFKKSAEQAYMYAQYNLARAYDLGFGYEINWKSARQWYEKAAGQGHSASLRNLGEFYLFGVGGVSKNKSTAINLFKKAIKNGDKKSSSYLKIINEIETQKSFMVNESNKGNKLFLTSSSLDEYSKYPVTISKYGNSWKIGVGYRLGDSQAVQIFPSSAAESNEEFKKKYSDELPMAHSYTPCDVLYESEGVHQSGLGLNYTKGYGSRSIGYIYYRAFFHQPSERVVLKTPAMICWKPKNEY